MRVEVILLPRDDLAISSAMLEAHRAVPDPFSNMSRWPRVGMAFVYMIPGVSFCVAKPARPWFLLAAMSVVSLVAAFYFVRFRQELRSVGRGRYVYTISAEGIHEESPRGKSLVRWSDVQAVQDAPEHISVIGQGIVALIPKRYLKALGPDVVLAKLREHWSSGRPQASDA